jgi:diaminohydroxyphosphoribosylaminopyrimidine deaminase / 5-amino-6-(5-phosphoribosylamino)uracil reductase
METSLENNMMQCLLLASQGIGYVSPNPLVGAMLVHNGNMIGAGYHIQYGTAHAEVNCIEAVSQANKHLIPDSTLYVTLEPCNHTGNTPPCTDFILQQGIKKVIVGTTDPNPKVNGSGIEKLRANGVEVITNILEPNCIAVNRRFFTYQTKKRPYIILKWAQTADGFIAAADKSTLKISGPETDKLTHLWRAQEDAIMVGYNTVVYDNPNLNVRHIEGRNPVRIVWDTNNNLAKTYNVFDASQATIIFNNKIEYKDNSTAYLKVDTLEEIIFKLYEYKTLSLLIEGGTKLLQQCIQAGLWDEARIITNKYNILQGYPAPKLSNSKYLYKDTKGTDTIEYFKNIENNYL